MVIRVQKVENWKTIFVNLMQTIKYKEKKKRNGLGKHCNISKFLKFSRIIHCPVENLDVPVVTFGIVCSFSAILTSKYIL